MPGPPQVGHPGKKIASKDNRPKKPSLRGKWCHRCNGRGWLPSAGHYATIDDQCPDCHFVGFVGITAAELMEVEFPKEGADA